jgi:23S rRNA (uracil1939-C5)-methyltransferase
VSVKIEALAFGGAMVGTVIEGAQDKIGKKAFIPFVVPGELVSARVVKDNKSFLEAECVEVIQSATERIEPACPYYKDCGGCHLQHITIKKQRELKLDLVRSALKTKGVICTEAITLVGNNLPVTGYRNRVLLRLSPEGVLGFYRSGSATIVPIKKCLIASAVINNAITELHKIKAALAPAIASISIEESDGKSVLVCNLREDAQRSAAGELKNLIYPFFPLYELKHKRKTIHSSFDSDKNSDKSYGHFSQVNFAGNDLLLSLVLDKVSDNNIDDLYAGNGNISFPLAAEGKTVRAVEFSKALVKSGNALAIQHKLNKNVSFIQSSCEKFAKHTTLASTVILDPPRAGAKEVVKRIRPEDTKTIVYVSCSPPTFVRDALVLQEKGYQLKEVQVLDMFPQTFHVELVSKWVLASST